MKMKLYIDRLNEYSKKDYFKSILSSVVVFLIIAYATKKNAFTNFEATKSLFFSYILCAVFVGLFNTISLWSEEHSYILPRIKSNLINIETYLGGTYISQTVLCILQGIIATLIFSYFFDYEKTGLVFSHSNIDIFITIFLTIECAMTLGLFVGLLLNSIKSAMTYLPLILIAQMLFSKGIFTLEGFTEKISLFIEARYGIAALGSICNINQYPLALKTIYPVIVQTPNTLFEYSKDYLLECWMHLLVLLIIPVVSAYIVLHFKVNKKQ